MRQRRTRRNEKRRKTRNPLSTFSDDELRCLYMFFVENQSVSDIALSASPSDFEKKSLWKHAKNHIYSLIWKLRYMLEERYGRTLRQNELDAQAASLLRRHRAKSASTRGAAAQGSREERDYSQFLFTFTRTLPQSERNPRPASLLL